jgi:cell division protein FtsB
MSVFFTVKLRNLNQSTTDENNETTITSDITELNLETIIVDKPPSESKQKSRSNLSRKTMKCLLLFSLILIIVLAVVTVLCIIRNHKLNKLLETKNAVIFTQQTKINNSLETIQILTNQLNRSQQRLGTLNKIIDWIDNEKNL